MIKKVTTLLSQQKLTLLKDFLNQELPFQQLPELLEQFPPNQQVILFRLLDKDIALEIFEVMEPNSQRELLDAFTSSEVAELFSGIDPSDQVRLLDELPAKVAKELLRSVPAETRDKASILMGFTAGTVGRVMSPHYLRLRRSDTVEEALATIRSLKPDREMLLDIWVTDQHRVLEGVVTLRDLVVSDPYITVGEIMDENTVYVSADTDQEDAVNIIQKFDLVSLPVVDSENRLIGNLEHDRALDIMELEATEDMLESGGVLNLQKREEDLSLRLTHGSLRQVLSIRLPFLFITLLGGLLAGIVVSQFEETLNSVVALAFFMPVVMDMGGNVGTQSTTIFSRSLALGHVRPKEVARPLRNELIRGIAIGAILGLGAAVVATIWQGEIRLGLVVGLSIIFTVTLASTLGFLVPWLMSKFNMDQAAGAGPIITTIKDVTGLFIYFGLASLLLGVI